MQLTEQTQDDLKAILEIFDQRIYEVGAENRAEADTLRVLMGNTAAVLAGN